MKLSYIGVNKFTVLELREDKAIIHCKICEGEDVMRRHVYTFLQENPEVIAQLKEFYPKDWDIIMVQENYGTFFEFGTPQIQMCGWEVNIKYNNNSTTIEFSNLK